MPTIEGLERFFPNMAPREFGGTVLLPKTAAEAGPTTMSHEGIHADISKLLMILNMLNPVVGAQGQVARIAAGTLPDDLNPEEEYAYRQEAPRDPYALKLRRMTREDRYRRHPSLAFLRGLYGDKERK